MPADFLRRCLSYSRDTDVYDAGIVKPAVSMVTTALEAASRVHKPAVLCQHLRVRILERIFPEGEGEDEAGQSLGVTLIPFAWNMNPDTERLYKGIV